MSTAPSGQEQLTRPVQYLRGVGPQRAELLQRLGLESAADVLFFFPRKYQDFAALASIGQLVEGQSASVLGVVADVQQFTSRGGTLVVAVLLEQEGQFLRAVWYNQAYLKSRFQVGQRVLLRGNPRNKEGRWEMPHPRPMWVEPGQQLDRSSLLAIYRLTEGLSQPRIRRIVADAVQQLAGTLDEVLPLQFRQTHQLCDIETAVRQIHVPRDQHELQTARKRLIFQELFVLQIALAMRRKQLQSGQSAPAMPIDAQIRSRILGRFPFQLTASQLAAADEIAADMSRNVPMNRLLHGEVGSGKTVVATYAILLAVAHGYQAAMMAPTEILAQQHVANLSKWLANSRVQVALWTGAVSETQRRQLQSDVSSGKTGIVVGTQALVQSQLPYHRLGLVVVDEQHKFGVLQRAQLRQAGVDPHYLVMTATPIPRTIAMTVFGDLEISTLKRRAPLAQQVHTYLGAEDSRDRWWEFFCSKLREGRQGYVIAPLVESSETGSGNTSSAEELLEALANGPLEAFRLDLLHGRQSPEHKSQVMERFVRGKTQVLVATSVVEVGIDVPNATVMTIESAERFGLSQLHQLRGRVSRGTHSGYVCVFSSPGNPQAQQRLDALVQCSDGFELAEIDLQLRGPGDFFGTQQHGMPPLRIADLIRDEAVLVDSRAAARQLIDDDPQLADPQWAALRRQMLARYGRALELGDVG